MTDRFEADYLIETPLDPARAAEVMAGEQSSGTFVRLPGETDALRDRSAATGPGHHRSTRGNRCRITGGEEFDIIPRQA